MLFVVITVNAQQFPDAAVSPVIVLVVVAEVHGQFLDNDAVEFPRTAATNPGVEF